MIAFLENKSVNHELVHSLLEECRRQNHWTNYGPLSRLLERTIASRWPPPPGYDVVVCASGTAGLHGLVQLHHSLWRRPLRWVVSSFSHHCCRQGPLQRAIVVDCDRSGRLSIETLSRIARDSYDGVIVTQLFGVDDHYDDIIDYCRTWGKIVLSDSAMTLETTIQIPRMVSFHHTKPWGFGEGGCVTIPTEHASRLRAIFNFGIDPDSQTVDESVRRFGFNGKMSDVAAAYILARIADFDTYAPRYRSQLQRLGRLAASCGFIRYDGTLCGCAAIVAPTPVTTIGLPFIAKKYYQPLADLPQARHLYDHILLIPAHPGVEGLSDDEIITALQGRRRG